MIISKKTDQYLLLVLINFLYALVAMADKYAASQVLFSLSFLVALGVAFLLMAIYAFSWQKVLHLIPLTEAYMFKGLSLIFIMILSYCFYGESITLNKFIGTIIIVVGIYSYARV